MEKKVVLRTELTQEEADVIYTNLEDELYRLRRVEDEEEPNLTGMEKIVKALKKVASRTRL